MATVSFQEFMKKAGGLPEDIKVISPASTKTEAPKELSTLGKVKSFGVGVAKGAGETLQSMQELGQRGLAAIDPTQTFEEVKQTTGIKSLAEADFSAKNKYETAGKTAEFLAEIFIPTSKSGVLSKAQKAGTSLIDDITAKASTISDDLVEGGVKVKDRVIEMASKLDDKTKTALSRTPREVFDSVVEQGKKAMIDDRLTTPIENVGKEFVAQAQKVKNRLTQIGKQKGEVLNKAKNAYQDVSKEVGETILNLRKQATQLGEDDAKFVNGIIDRLKPYLNKGKLKDVDTLIDDIQDQIYKLSESDKAVQLTDRVMGVVRNGVEGLNSKIQAKVGGSYQDLNKKYSETYRLLTDINRAVGKKGERAGSFMKQFFSPAGQTAKNLIAQMEKITGVDFSRDARLAKFVMESLGDRRVESLLEQIPKATPNSFTEAGMKAIEFIMKKTGIDDPLEAARVFIEKQK